MKNPVALRSNRVWVFYLLDYILGLVNGTSMYHYSGLHQNDSIFDYFETALLLNWASSVEPSSARTDEWPPWITVVTSSK